MAEELRNDSVKKEKFNLEMCSRAEDLDCSVEADRNDMLRWIKEDSENFTLLKKPDKQYFADICDIFVAARLKKTDQSAEKSKFCYSLDYLPCIKLDYSTYKNEEFEYFDSDLEISTYLECHFSALLKITDCMKLLYAMDMRASDFSIGAVYEKLRLAALQSWRSVVSEMVQQKVGYYRFVQNMADVSAKLSAALNQKMKVFGIAVSDVNILRISIPESVKEQIRRNSYESKRDKDRYAAEVQFADMYLENYRKKAEIQNQCGVVALTEFEKDRALERYLVRVNNERKTSVAEEHLEVRAEDVEKPVEPKKPNIARPEPPAQGGKIVGFIVGAVAGLLAAILGVMMRRQSQTATIGIALIVIGALAVVGCATMAVLRFVGANKRRAQQLAEYESKLKMYDTAQEQYEIELEEYRKQLAKYNAQIATEE